MKVRYIRLLSYDNACKVIEFIKNLGGENYANITVGGVSTQVIDEDWDSVITYIETLTDYYEIGEDAPHVVTSRIIQSLKDDEIIE